MGEVYRADDLKLGQPVALKFLPPGFDADVERLQRLLAEVRTARQVSHTNVCRIYDAGEADGHHFLSMEYVDGEDLASLLRRIGYLPKDKAIQVARQLCAGLAAAHEIGVLHRDLKPANILLDDGDEPHVSDFGAAKRTDQQESMTGTSKLIGTPIYMAPEQARGGGQSTMASDVYSLGVVLYQLVTGQPPFDGDIPTILRKVVETEPTRPRDLEQTVPRDLETICLKCLEKDPAARYRSAQELADDLERFLRSEPIAARPPTRIERVGRLARRHWLSVGISVALILLLAVVAVTAFDVARAQEQELLYETLQTNAYAAHAHAGSVAWRLRELTDIAVATAADPSIAQMLHAIDQHALEQRRAGTPFDTITLINRTGTMIAQAPIVGPGLIGLDYSWRDYFIGAQRLGEAKIRGGYISRALLSETDKTWKFGITAPLYEDGKWVGVLLFTVGTDSALGGARLDRTSDAGPMAVVVAPQDRSRNSRAEEGKYVVILHDGLAHGDSVLFDSLRLGELRVMRADRKGPQWVDFEPLKDDEHHDPVPGFEGRWLAGFAPVGETGFVVIVQTRHDAAVAPSARLWSRLVWRATIALLGWIVVFVCLVLYARRRRRGRSVAPRQRSAVLTG
jgi:serine/threonine-protein kinase